MAANGENANELGGEIDHSKSPVLSFPDFGDCEDAYMHDDSNITAVFIESDRHEQNEGTEPGHGSMELGDPQHEYTGGQTGTGEHGGLIYTYVCSLIIPRFS